MNLNDESRKISYSLEEQCGISYGPSLRGHSACPRGNIIRTSSF